MVVRAGAPNAATTSCFSSAVREPLAGREAVVPVGPDVFHAVTGYRAAVGGMLALHEAPPAEADWVLGHDWTAFRGVRRGFAPQRHRGILSDQG